MWVEFEIDGKKYFLMYKVDSGSYIDCVLYDGKQSWHEKQELCIIVKRAKDMNKRILQLDEALVKGIFQNSKPVEANWIEDEPHCSKNSNLNQLKLKYILGTYPFHFTWNFCKQTEHEFQQFILFPLFRIVQGLNRQNEELREIVRKKDREINQYKAEGAILKIVTVATPTFNFTKFDEKYADTIESTKEILQISDLLKAQYKPMQTPIKSNHNVQGESAKDNDVVNDVKLTPRRRRRKLLEEQERRHVEKIKTRARILEYESSQSEQLTPSSTDVSENETDKKKQNPKISPNKKIEIDVANKVKDKNENSQSPSPKKSHKETVKSPTERRNLVKVQMSETPLENNQSPQLIKKSSPAILETETEKTKLPKMSPAKSPEINVQIKVQEKFEDTQSIRTQKCTVKIPTSNTRSLRKRKPTDYVENEESQTSSEDSVPVQRSKKEETNTSPAQIVSQLNTSDVSDDIRSIIDEWKKLEELRVADLKNIRTTRTGKRISN